MGLVLDRLLAAYPSEIATRRVVIDPGAIRSLPELLRGTFGKQKNYLLVADSNTWSAAGIDVSELLANAALPSHPLILEPLTSHRVVHADSAQVRRVETRLEEDNSIGLTVGSGAINDIVKMASHRRRKPCVAVATAPSMNGWTSGIAAVVEDGLKKTIPVRGPVLVIGDIDILRNAPARMIGAGLADLMAKWVASADWHLADRLFDTGFDNRIESISRSAIDLVEGHEAEIAGAEPEAIEMLMEALCVSGLSMALAGSSQHISGAEHLFSHYIDMMLPDVAERELHGRQVGIGTLCSAALYEMLLEWRPEDLDIDARVARQPSAADRRREVEKHFGPLAPVVLPEMEAVHAEGERLRERLLRLREVWPDLRAAIGPSIASRSAIEERIQTAGAPIHYSDLGLTEEQTRGILRWSRDIRSRYTILHLAGDLGTLDSWISYAVKAF